MKVFTIDAKGRIQVQQMNGRPKKAGLHFTSEAQWTAVAADLPMARLVGIWNSLAGVTPVARFTSRAAAAKRIWKVIESVEPKAGKPLPDPESTVTVQSAGKKEKGATRQESKKAQIIALLKVDAGVSIDQLTRVTGWQKHSIRGFLSGTMRKKMGLKVVSTKDTNGTRLYRIA
jgi:hypothetical protein